MKNFVESEEKRRSLLERREFVSTVLKTIGISSLLTIPGIGISAAWANDRRDYTVQEVIDLILKEIPGAPFKETVDTIKSGTPDQKVTGIVTTMFATVEVIRATARLGANFIVAHEPTFYNHLDDTNWVQQNAVVKQKQELLQKHNIAIWRFHDYWHAYRPDGILTGVLKELRLEKYKTANEHLLLTPPLSLKVLIDLLKERLGIKKLRVIGDLSQICKRIAILPGAAGGQTQIAFIEKEKPDVFICGEVHEWETAEYIRDARQMGSKTSLIILGHSVSEEPGMNWLVQWLQPKIPEIKITHIASKDPFLWI